MLLAGEAEMSLMLEPNISEPDEVFARLSQLFSGLDDEACAQLNAKLLLILINHIGDQKVLLEAFEKVTQSAQN